MYGILSTLLTSLLFRSLSAALPQGEITLIPYNVSTSNSSLDAVRNPTFWRSTKYALVKTRLTYPHAEVVISEAFYVDGPTLDEKSYTHYHVTLSDADGSSIGIRACCDYPVEFGPPEKSGGLAPGSWPINWDYFQYPLNDAFQFLNQHGHPGPWHSVLALMPREQPLRQVWYVFTRPGTGSPQKIALTTDTREIINLTGGDSLDNFHYGTSSIASVNNGSMEANS